MEWLAVGWKREEKAVKGYPAHPGKSLIGRF